MGPLVLPAGQAGGHVTASPASPLQLSRWAHGLTSRLFQINWLPAAAGTMASAVNTVQPAASSLLSQPRLTAHCQAGLGGPVRGGRSSTADCRARGYVTTWHTAYVSVLLSTGGVLDFDNDTVKAYLLITYLLELSYFNLCRMPNKQLNKLSPMLKLAFRSIIKLLPMLSM